MNAARVCHVTIHRDLIYGVLARAEFDTALIVGSCRTIIVAGDCGQCVDGTACINSEQCIKRAAKCIPLYHPIRRRLPAIPNRFAAGDAAMIWFARFFVRAEICAGDRAGHIRQLLRLRKIIIRWHWHGRVRSRRRGRARVRRTRNRRPCRMNTARVNAYIVEPPAPRIITIVQTDAPAKTDCLSRQRREIQTTGYISVTRRNKRGAPAERIVVICVQRSVIAIAIKQILRVGPICAAVRTVLDNAAVIIRLLEIIRVRKPQARVWRQNNIRIHFCKRTVEHTGIIIRIQKMLTRMRERAVRRIIAPPIFRVRRTKRPIGHAAFKIVKENG